MFLRTLFLLSLILPPPAFAGGFNLPDPPNTVTYDKIQLRVVQAPRGKVPAGCDARYRAQMEGSFRRVWEQCQAIGKEEPSDCQRGLFDRCTKLAQELQSMESGACLEMLGERDALDRIQNPDSQRNAQESSSDLNRRAAAASRKVADILGRHAKGLAQHRQGGSQALTAATCALSSSAPAYKQTEGKLLAEVKATEKYVAAEVASRNASAAELDKNAAKAGASAAELKSLADAGMLPTTNRTAIDTVTVTQTPASSTATSTATTPWSPVAPRSRFASPPILPSEEKKIDWVPILAVGIPAAAILGGIAFSKRNRGGDEPTGSGPAGGPAGDPGPGGTDPSGNDPSPGGSDPSPGPGPQPGSTDTSPVPGGGDLRSLNMTLDSSFTDAQKGIIAHAVLKVPSCHRGKLRNLRVSSANLGGRRGGLTCVAGLYRLGGYEVKLDPGCVGIQVGITLHEFMHVVGNRNGNALHQAYLREVYQKHRNCPVSKYGATHWMEDFAEAGRLTYFPRGGQKNAQACVDAKLSGLNRLMTSCSQQ